MNTTNIQNMFNRITENKKTTIAGGVIFATGIALVIMDKATLTEFGGFLGVAFALLFSKDPKATK